jgi:UPF0716 family protein affecting phage T7 exclusion
MAEQKGVGDYIKGGVDIYKANFAPLFVASLLAWVPGVQTNALAQILRFRANGQSMDIGGLFDFENVVHKFLSSMLGVFPILPLHSMPLLAEHPGLSFVDSWKAGWAFGKNEIGGVIILLIAAVAVALSGLIGCCIGVVFTMPLLLPIMAVAYEDKREAILAAAKEAGIELPEATSYAE